MNEDLRMSYEKDQSNFLEDKLRQLQIAAETQRLRTTWEIVNEIGGRKGPAKNQKMKRADGTSINSDEELLKEWKIYFDNLLNVAHHAAAIQGILPGRFQALGRSSKDFRL